jgi:hypothetical protein
MQEIKQNLYMSKTHTIDLGVVPTKIQISKRKVAYVSYNTIYGGAHYSVRKKVVDTMKSFVTPFFKELPVIKKPIHLTISYYSKRTTWDLDNRCGLWCKVILDTLKQHWIIEDNVKYVPELKYEFIRTDDTKDYIILKIKEL